MSSGENSRKSSSSEDRFRENEKNVEWENEKCEVGS
jgi:hypothetical protein